MRSWKRHVKASENGNTASLRARLTNPAMKQHLLKSRDRQKVHHGPKGQSELRSLGQAEAYPTKPPAFPMWGKLQLAQPGDSPALASFFQFSHSHARWS
jgi:hypothetical protein